MKLKFLIVLLLIGMISCKPGADNNTKKEEIKSLLSDYYASLAKKDFTKMKDLTTSDFVLFEEGAIYNNDGVVKELESMGSITVSFRFDSLNIHFDKANASAYYFREADFTVSDSMHQHGSFLESATFEKQNGKWKLRFLHSSKRENNL
jgi:ketosteroid isomerase-like protein